MKGQNSPIHINISGNCKGHQNFHCIPYKKNCVYYHLKDLVTPFTFQMNKKSSTTRTTNMSRKKSNMRKQENMMKKANLNDKSRTKSNMKKRRNTNRRKQQTSSKSSSSQKQSFASFAERLKVLRAQVSTNYEIWHRRKICQIKI